MSRAFHRVVVQEKYDGSRLGIFKISGKLIVNQSGYDWTVVDIESNLSSAYYEGLYEWLKKNYKTLMKSMREGLGVYGTWLGTSSINYENSDITSEFYVDRRAQIYSCINRRKYEVSSYTHTFKAIRNAFYNRKMPSCIAISPIIDTLYFYPKGEEVDSLYKDYVSKLNRECKGLTMYFNACRTQMEHIIPRAN